MTTHVLLPFWWGSHLTPFKSIFQGAGKQLAPYHCLAFLRKVRCVLPTGHWAPGQQHTNVTQMSHSSDSFPGCQAGSRSGCLGVSKHSTKAEGSRVIVCFPEAGPKKGRSRKRAPSPGPADNAFCRGGKHCYSATHAAGTRHSSSPGSGLHLQCSRGGDGDPAQVAISVERPRLQGCRALHPLGVLTECR